MRTIGGLIILALILVASPYLWGEVERRKSDEIDVPRLVECLRQMEGGSPDKLGGEWCVQYSVWHDRAAEMSYGESRDPRKCREVAGRQVRWLIAQLGENSVHPTVERVSHCYRYGLDSYLLARRTGDYGRRAANLYNAE